MQNRLGRQDMQDGNKNLFFALTRDILKCCFEVIQELGSGFLESIYKNALLIALKDHGITAFPEKSYEMFFRGQKIGYYVADIVVENAVIIELKKCETLLPEHQAQLINYLNVTKLPVGLLVNFGNRKLQYKRFYHPASQSPELISMNTLSHPAYSAGEADPAYPVLSLSQESTL